MQQPEAGKCVGLTEMAVYQYVPQVNANVSAALSEIKLDGQALADFAPDKMEYTVEVETLPTTVEAIGQSNAAVTVLPIYNNKSLIVVRSEAGTKNVYTINYVLDDVEPELVLDINGDGAITIGDLAIVSKNFGNVVSGNELSEKSDINKDGVVNTEDLKLIIDNIFGN